MKDTIKTILVISVFQLMGGIVFSQEPPIPDMAVPEQKPKESEIYQVLEEQA